MWLSCLVLPVRANTQGQDKVLLVKEGRIRHIAVQTGLKKQVNPPLPPTPAGP